MLLLHLLRPHKGTDASGEGRLIIRLISKNNFPSSCPLTERPKKCLYPRCSGLFGPTPTDLAAIRFFHDKLIRPKCQLPSREELAMEVGTGSEVWITPGA